MPEPDLLYLPELFSGDEAEVIQAQLARELGPHMRQGQIRMFGKLIDEPRKSLLVAAHDDFAGQTYTYSRKTMTAMAPTDVIARLVARIEPLCETRFSYALVNLYEHGDHAMGWHADDEPEIGPVIASLSFGAPRRFRLRHNTVRGKRGRYIGFDARLASGSLLVMRGDTQEHWQHCVPREKHVQAPRWNLTFRRIVALG